MPSRHPVVVALRGTDQYTRALARLERAVRAKGVQLPEGPHALADHALVVLAAQHGIRLPARVPPHGTNQHGEPRARPAGKIPAEGC